MRITRKLTIVVILVIFIPTFAGVYFVFFRSPYVAVSLKLNGSSELGLDIVFIPEDYTPREMDKFRETVEIYYQTLLSIEPFSSYRDRINIWRIDTTIDFESRRMKTQPHILTVNVDKVIQFVESIIDLDFAHAPNDQIIVLVNNSTYGGFGSRDVAVAYTGQWGKNMMIHEFGHSFGRLGDEYLKYDSDWPAGTDILYPNIDWDGSKWKDVPGTGAYLGALYRNLVRSTYDSCVMRRIDYFGYGPVCKTSLESLLESYSS